MTTSRIEPEAPSHRQSASAEILGAALEQFATAGFAGTSLQQIADAAGYSKSSVLYHFTSKEALLEAAIGPAVDRLENVLGGLARLRESSEARELFVEEFIDFLLEYRLEVHTFINQGQSLVGIPEIDRANAVLGGLTSSFAAGLTTVEEKLRFGVALGGAAYELVASMNFGDEKFPHEERRSALITIVSELLAPIQTPQTTA
ncbi:MAG: TetR/AcrR family transcriptional regulator [Microbacteriaceae bacterium]|nr:TetR/AcrR family transcriptional regulator [Microbacteriaceae bacterium]